MLTTCLDTGFVTDPACCSYSSCEIVSDTAQWRMTLAAQTVHIKPVALTASTIKTRPKDQGDDIKEKNKTFCLWLCTITFTPKSCKLSVTSKWSLQHLAGVTVTTKWLFKGFRAERKEPISSCEVRRKAEEMSPFSQWWDIKGFLRMFYSCFELKQT